MGVAEDRVFLFCFCTYCFSVVLKVVSFGGICYILILSGFFMCLVVPHNMTASDFSHGGFCAPRVDVPTKKLQLHCLLSWKSVVLFMQTLQIAQSIPTS